MAEINSISWNIRPINEKNKNWPEERIKERRITFRWKEWIGYNRISRWKRKKCFRHESSHTKFRLKKIRMPASKEPSWRGKSFLNHDSKWWSNHEIKGNWKKAYFERRWAFTEIRKEKESEHQQTKRILQKQEFWDELKWGNLLVTENVIFRR